MSGAPPPLPRWGCSVTVSRSRTLSTPKERGRWEFMLTVNPLRNEGCTGSPVNTVAVV